MTKGSPSPTIEREPVAHNNDYVRQEVKSGKLPVIGNMKESTKTKIKIGISLVLFASLFLFGKVDLSKSWQAALTAHKGFLFAALFLFLCTPLLNAQRWKLLASAIGLGKPLLKMAQYCYVGTFFNLFLPSTVGGDFSRCYYLSKGTGRYLHALSTVLVDRAMGLAVLLMFATFGLLLGPGGQELPMNLKAPIFVLTVGVFGVVPFMPALSSKVLGPENWLSKKLNESTAKVFWQDKGLIFTAFLLSIVLQVMIVFCHVGVGAALGIDLPLWYYFVFYPSVAVLGFVTPSINGIGIREWAYTYFLTFMGIESSRALTFAIIWLGFITLLSLVGGIVYMLGHFKISEEEKRKIQAGVDI